MKLSARDRYIVTLIGKGHSDRTIRMLTFAPAERIAEVRYIVTVDRSKKIMKGTYDADCLP